MGRRIAAFLLHKINSFIFVLFVDNKATLAIMNTTKTNKQEYTAMNKATFQASDVNTFANQCDAQWNKNWEAYKKQSSGNVLYTKPAKVVDNNGFKLGMIACVPVIMGVISVMF